MNCSFANSLRHDNVDLGTSSVARYVCMLAREYCELKKSQSTRGNRVHKSQFCYAAPIGALFCPEIRALTGDFFDRFQGP